MKGGPIINLNPQCDSFLLFNIKLESTKSTFYEKLHQSLL